MSKKWQVYQVENEKVAKHLIEQRKIKQREQELKANNRVTLEDLFSKIKDRRMLRSFVFFIFIS